eukprot:gene7338-9739_t
MEVTLALLKPDIALHPHRIQTVLRSIQGSGFQCLRYRKHVMKREEAHRFYKEHEGKFFFRRLVDYTTSGPTIALALARPDGIHVWRSMLGSTKVYKAHINQQQTLRGIFGLSDTRNSLHGSDTIESAQRELALFFPKDVYQNLVQEAVRVP